MEQDEGLFNKKTKAKVYLIGAGVLVCVILLVIIRHQIRKYNERKRRAIRKKYRDDGRKYLEVERKKENPPVRNNPKPQMKEKKQENSPQVKGTKRENSPQVISPILDPGEFTSHDIQYLQISEMLSLMNKLQRSEQKMGESGVIIEELDE